MNNQPIIQAKKLGIRFDTKWVLRDLDLQINQGEVMAIVGGSGSGKSTLLRALLMLLQPAAGSIELFGIDATTCSDKVTQQLQRRWGMLFQGSALFSSLTVLENIVFVMQQQAQLNYTTACELARLKIVLAGLPSDSANKYPSELSGGMQKRAALARALALDPELLFLDEPTAGLDPVAANAFDELILNLQQALKLTIVMVTHDLDSLWRVSDRVTFLGKGKVLAIAPIAELSKMEQQDIQAYFDNPRARAAQHIKEE